MHDVWSPTQFFNRLNHPLAKEDGALVIVVVKTLLLVVKHVLALKIIFVIDEVHLKLGIGNGSHLDDQGLFFLTHRNVDSR